MRLAPDFTTQVRPENTNVPGVDADAGEIDTASTVESAHASATADAATACTSPARRPRTEAVPTDPDGTSGQVAEPDDAPVSGGRAGPGSSGTKRCTATRP